ncbi:hypothetical protein C2845_PM03G23270 [Panicum miliaceum]|uniref:Uncharacterized protein n=1 Tax=Panicum miliaceum TaxID=4540 RepID=A0A3L6T7P2_PANMI|nr:hypothetical protein C2845_PM03G23270 [Panicum miliaceum]
MIIDGETRLNRDFVRMKIACRGINKVPPSTESTLGLNVYDFFFERESDSSEDEANLRGAEEVRLPENQPSPKKQRTVHTMPGASDPKAGPTRMDGSSQQEGKQVNAGDRRKDTVNRNYGSAPGKLFGGNIFVKQMGSKSEVGGGGGGTSSNMNKDMGTPEVAANFHDPLSGDDVIPAATYEPYKDITEEDSGEATDSNDFEERVNKVLGMRLILQKIGISTGWLGVNSLRLVTSLRD